MRFEMVLLFVGGIKSWMEMVGFEDLMCEMGLCWDGDEVLVRVVYDD